MSRLIFIVVVAMIALATAGILLTERGKGNRPWNAPDKQGSRNSQRPPWEEESQSPGDESLNQSANDGPAVDAAVNDDAEKPVSRVTEEAGKSPAQHPPVDNSEVADDEPGNQTENEKPPAEIPLETPDSVSVSTDATGSAPAGQEASESENSLPPDGTGGE